MPFNTESLAFIGAKTRNKLALFPNENDLFQLIYSLLNTTTS